MRRHPFNSLCFGIVIVFFVGQGNGHWKHKDVKKLQYEIRSFRKMAETLEHEIEDIYNDYPEKMPISSKIDDYESKHSYKKHYNSRTKTSFDNHKGLLNTKPDDFTKNDDKTDVILKNINNTPVKFIPYNFKPDQNDTKNVIKAENSWPKFDDILSAIGKQYNWKTDRWIKVKKKLKKTPVKPIQYSDDKIDFLSKHKFNYRTVKLNRSKSKRNVIIAVNAVGR